MLFQILKKDMMKRKGVNSILFLFMTLATVFLASSVNNIVVVSSAVNYYMNYANTPDLNVIASSDEQKDEIDAWFQSQKEEGNITDIAYNNFLIVTEKNVLLEDDTVIETDGISLYVSTMDVEYAKVYDENGNSFILNDDEIALTNALLEKNQLAIGDKISIQIGDVKQEFTIKIASKDAVYGSEMVGMSRFIVNQNVYDKFNQNVNTLGIYYIMSPNVAEVSHALDLKNFSSIMNTIPKSLYMKIYSFDMIMAGLLILIGICLILIALLVLRFTLVFTMEEQYHEIGILKAVGLRNYAIKKLYLIKYLAIVSAGSLIGLLMSIPISNIMVQSVSKNIIMENSDANFYVNIICVIIMIILVLSFCYFCTKKLNKVSAITAIRGGQDGERFHKLRGISLAKRKYMNVSFYLGLNDILCDFRRFLILVITFSISFILITIPLNTLNTMQSAEMFNKFMLNPQSATYVRSIELDTEEKYNRVEQLQTAMSRIKQELSEKGYEDVAVTGTPIYFLSIASSGSEQNRSIMTLQLKGDNIDFPIFEEGSAPTLENEIAFSKTIMNENNWSIGDYVDIPISGVVKTMIITASYTDYMQLGKSARLNPLVDCSNEVMFDYWTVMVDMKTDLNQEELSNILQQQFPDYEWSTAQKLVDQNVGGIQNILKGVLLPMTLMLCIVIMLITLLMEKLFITREKGQIAMLKSIGVSYVSIRNWQMLRMNLVVLSSMIIAIPLSFLSNQFMLKPIFAIMGADVSIQIDTLQVYVLYPCILLIGIIIATYLAVRSVKYINIREINNME